MFKKSPEKLLLEAEKHEARVDHCLHLARDGASLSIRRENVLPGMQALGECFETLGRIDPSNRPSNWNALIQRLDNKHDEFTKLRQELWST